MWQLTLADEQVSSQCKVSSILHAFSSFAPPLMPVWGPTVQESCWQTLGSSGGYWDVWWIARFKEKGGETMHRSCRKGISYWIVWKLQSRWQWLNAGRGAQRSWEISIIGNAKNFFGQRPGTRWSQLVSELDGQGDLLYKLSYPKCQLSQHTA